MNLSVLIFLIIYFIIIIAIGYLSSRKESDEDFLIGNRNLGALTIALTIAAGFIGGNTLVNFTGFVYTYGGAMIWAMLGTILGFVVVIPMAKRMREYTKTNKFYTLADYLSSKYGKSVGLIATLIIMIWFILSLCVQFIAGSSAIQLISSINYPSAILLMGIIVLIYLFLGGFKAVVKTDIFQYILFTLLFILAIFTISKQSNINLSSFLEFKEVGVLRLFSFFVIAMGFVITAPELWQRVYASRNTKETIKGLTITSILVTVVSFCIGILGLSARSSFLNIQPEQAALLGLSQLLPPALIGIGVVIFFAVIMSSIDTTLFILANNFSNDIWSKYIDKQTNLVKTTKISLIFFALVTTIISLLFRDILTLGLSFLSIGLSFAPVLICSFYFELKPSAVKLSLLTALFSVFILIGLGIVRPETSIISLPVSLVFLIIGQIFFKKTPENSKVISSL